MNKATQKFKIDIYTLGLVAVSLIYLIKLISIKDTMLDSVDNAYLINRASQMLTCIKDGNVPFFYYNDFAGVGYGSSFFYGQLTLYPFLPLLLIGKLPFLYAYITVAYIINVIGILQLTKRFTSEYKFISLIYMCSTLNLLLFITTKMYANMMGFGLGFLFLAYMIDFIRDNKKSGFILAGIFYFLLINTHLITALLCFIITILVLVYYFDKKRLLDYFKFALYVCALCSYFIANFVYHSGALNDLKSINKFVITNVNMINSYSFHIFPFELLGQHLLGASNGLFILDIVTLIILLITLIKNYKGINIKTKALLLFSILMIILSTKYAWIWFNLDVYTTPLQFAYRYVPFVFAFLLIVILSKIKSKDLKLFLYSWTIIYFLISMCIIQIKPYSTPHFSDLDACVGHGEYVNKNFNCSSEEFRELSRKVTDKNNKEYEYSINGNIISFNIDTKEDTNITIPKLYYKGYVAYLDNNKLKISEGKSQFINITIKKNSKGIVKVYYKHPIWLIIWDIICLITMFSSLAVFCIKNKKMEESKRCQKMISKKFYATFSQL